MNHWTYEEYEALAESMARHLISIYFKGVSREKVSGIDAFLACPSFIKDTWMLMADKIIGDDE